MYIFISKNVFAIDAKEICVYKSIESSIEILVNSMPVKSNDAVPFIDSNNRTQCPIRAFADSINAIISWDDNAKTATLHTDDITLELTANSNKMIVNDSTIEMDTSPVFINDRIFIPVRFIAEAIGYNINYREKQDIKLFTHVPSFSDYESISSVRTIRIDTNSNIVIGNEFCTNCYFVNSNENANVLIDLSHVYTNPGSQSFKLKLMSMITNQPLFEYNVQSDSNGKISFSEKIPCHESFYIKIDNISDTNGAIWGEASIVVI